VKKSAAIFLLAFFAVALSAAFTGASATKMNGKCCQSSDGGRSHRYHMAISEPQDWLQFPAPAAPTRPAVCAFRARRRIGSRCARPRERCVS
jgi:hypothetical protein